MNKLTVSAFLEGTIWNKPKNKSDNEKTDNNAEESRQKHNTRVRG